jgi:hypothetical protein
MMRAREGGGLGMTTNAPWHRLYFLPLLHGQSWLRPILANAQRLSGSSAAGLGVAEEKQGVSIYSACCYSLSTATFVQ